MRRILRKVAQDKPDELGDVSTLADPSVVEEIVRQHLELMQKVRSKHEQAGIQSFLFQGTVENTGGKGDWWTDLGKTDTSVCVLFSVNYIYTEEQTTLELMTLNDSCKVKNMS